MTSYIIYIHIFIYIYIYIYIHIDAKKKRTIVNSARTVARQRVRKIRRRAVGPLHPQPTPGGCGNYGAQETHTSEKSRGKKWRWWKNASRGVARRIRTMLKIKKQKQQLANEGKPKPKERRDRHYIGKRNARPNLRRNGGKLRRVGQKGKRTGINISVATINARGLGETGKRMTIERWADKHRVDVVCVTETHHPHSSMELTQGGLYVDQERIRETGNGSSARAWMPKN